MFLVGDTVYFKIKNNSNKVSFFKSFIKEVYSRDKELYRLSITSNKKPGYVVDTFFVGHIVVHEKDLFSTQILLTEKWMPLK